MLRKRFDGLKYDLKKIEEGGYQFSMSFNTFINYRFCIQLSMMFPCVIWHPLPSILRKTLPRTQRRPSSRTKTIRTFSFCFSQYPFSRICITSMYSKASDLLTLWLMNSILMHKAIDRNRPAFLPKQVVVRGLLNFWEQPLLIATPCHSPSTSV